MTISEIRAELRSVRYYYSRFNAFKEAEREIGANIIADKVGKYNELIKTAPPVLYDIYNGLYVRFLTQERLASDMGYTIGYIQFLNKKLLLYLQGKIDKGGMKDE